VYWTYNIILISAAEAGTKFPTATAVHVGVDIDPDEPLFIIGNEVRLDPDATLYCAVLPY
jgi:hypothetical protein